MSSIDKAEIKRGTIKQIGTVLDDKMEAAKAEIHRFEGSMGALKQAVEKLEGHKTYWRKDFEEDKIDQDKLKQAFIVIDQCEGILRNLRDAAMTHKMLKQGELTGITTINDYCMKLFEEEGNKAQAVLAMLESSQLVGEGGPLLQVVTKEEAARPPGVDRPTGVHPGLSEAQLRKGNGEIKQTDVAAQESAAKPLERQRKKPGPKPGSKRKKQTIVLGKSKDNGKNS